METGVIKTEINAIDSFNLSMYMNNPGYGNMKPIKTLIKVKNNITGVYEFEGRVLLSSENMDNDGIHSTSYVCEGELAYLHDAQQRHLEFRGSPSDLFHTILNYYNSQVEDYKRFEVGEINVTNSTDNLYVYLSAEKNTFETIKEKLIDKIGGELQVRKENGVRYLDLLDRIGEDRDTKIKLSKNLINMSRDVNPSDVVTRLTPLGKRIESSDQNATDASQARLTIESVNNGLPYIDRQDLIDAGFGYRGGKQIWDDISVESNLYNAGWEWLNNQKISLNQYKVAALDLSLIGLDIDDFKKGDSYPVDNPVMAIDERLRVIGTSKDINEPQDGSLTIGDKFKSLYEYENESRKSAQAVNELSSRVDRLSSANGTLNEQLIQAQADLNTLQGSIQNIDMENLPEELQGVSLQITSLQNDIDNLAIPNYGLATPTEDGLMSAGDKTKLDGLQTYDVATELQDGLMSSEDKTSLETIVTDVGDVALLETANTADLVQAINELNARIETLEGGAQ